MNLSKNQIIIIGIAGIIVLFFILLFLGVIPGLKKSGTGGNFGTIGGGSETVVNFWGIADSDNDAKAIRAVIEEYQKINKGVRIDFTAFDNAKNYEKTLLNAFATGKAPDIVAFHNTWLTKHCDKIIPIPETVFPLSALQQLFPQVVEQDFVLRQTHSASSGQAQDKSLIVALPLYIDTLALLYNKDMFDAKAISLPPTTWQTFQNLVPYLREVNLLNQITKPASAIGGSEKNIDNASDLLNLLMMQFGSKMIDDYGKSSFVREGLPALNFYLQFSNPNSPYYTWNENLRYSLNSFSDGSTAMIFNYASRIPLIKAKNPYFNVGIAPMPQPTGISQPLNYADYWGLSVSNQSRQSDLAWNFILFASANPQTAEIYLQAAKKPPALRSLIQKYINDPELGVFSRQALTARSWRQPDSNAIKQIFSNIIESILSGKISPQQGLEQAENEINGL
ncbi:MAG: extracellular solute-binding protein [bacterium]|nr:extracellular solute-binding protein [bacterium]